MTYSIKMSASAVYLLDMKGKVRNTLSCDMSNTLLSQSIMISENLLDNWIKGSYFILLHERIQRGRTGGLDHPPLENHKWPDAFLWHFIEYTLLGGSGVLSLYGARGEALWQTMV